jgi:hypothetical protein
MRATGIVIGILLLAACGQAPAKPTSAVVSPSPSATGTVQPSASANPSPSVKPSPTPLFAVLEAKGTANAWTYNTVAIAGLDGYARAKATFTPMPVPVLGCMGAILPSQAHVAAGKVYFADAHGVIRSLATDGRVMTAATFPMTSTQQMLSFAVSPDGGRIIGTVFTLPNNASSCSGPGSGTFTFDAYSSTGPSTNQLVYHQTWTAAPGNVMALMGWDSVGPFGTYPTVWASQGGGPGSTLGVYTRINATTLKPGAQFSDPYTCRVWDSISTGAFVCTQDGVITNPGAQQSVSVPVSVRRADGSQSWQFTISGTNGPSTPFLNPDGAHVIMCCSDDGHEWLIGQDGSKSMLGPSFYGSGWIDATTVVGEYHLNPLAQPPLPLAYVALKAPGTVVSMGFAGLFVGTVRA